MKVRVAKMVHDLKRVEVSGSAALWDWLSANHQSGESYLLVTWKTSNQDKYVSRDEVLDALLAYGWIDGRRYALDEARTMQLIGPRKQQKWTKSYRDRVERLTVKGMMQPSGTRAVNEAKARGTWLANRDVDALICPPDLFQALQSQRAAEWWDSAAPSYKRNVLRWLSLAKRQETRDKRCAEIAQACSAGIKIKNL